MEDIRMIQLRGLVACVLVLGATGGARGQSAASASAAASSAATSSGAASSGLGAANGLGTANGMGMGMGNGMNLGMGMGMGIIPFAYALNPSATLSPTDAAALGMQAPQSNGMAAQVNSLLANPLAAPMIYGGMSANSPNQVGMMMLANQSALGGIGSGQLSGARQGGRGRTQGMAPTAARAVGSANQPGGLAARYFHRTTTIARHPQTFYNQQSRYFPQIAR
jgi:hypothetical protein